MQNATSWRGVSIPTGHTASQKNCATSSGGLPYAPRPNALSTATLHPDSITASTMAWTLALMSSLCPAP
eukprot:15477877-Alexandrium_andersonii.AAC.1